MLPTVSAKAAAKKAVAVLEKIATFDAGCLFYVMQASNILALAGLRAQSPYNEFEPSFSQKKQALLSKILHNNGYEILYEKYPYSTDKRNIFSLINIQELDNLPKRYIAIRPIWEKAQKPNDSIDLFFWSETLQVSLVKLMNDHKLPKDWLLDWWAPHNIRFGMLLGYPGPAISSYCWDEAHHSKGEPVGKEHTSSFPFQGIYSGTHVNYGYSARLQNDVTIRAHQQLWTDVLTDVYSVFSENRLMSLTEFKHQYHRFKAYDESS